MNQPLTDDEFKDLKEYEHCCLDMLAMLHRDGGHYHIKHGTEKATKDAITNYYKMVYELTEENAKLKDKLKGAI